MPLANGAAISIGTNLQFGATVGTGREGLIYTASGTTLTMNADITQASQITKFGTGTLAISKDGDKLTGTMTFQDKQEAKLKDPKFKDGELTFSVDRKLMDNTIKVEYKLKFDADKFKGKGAVDSGGQNQNPALCCASDADQEGGGRQ